MEPVMNGKAMSDAPFDIFLAGDAMLVVPWSSAVDDATLRLFAAMRGADVTILNLETVIHNFEGYAQADSGGTWMRSSPEIASELSWAGVDMVAHANNHAFDYGSEGILQTVRHTEAAGLVISGSGHDLQRARAPGFVERSRRTVAHVSMASDFVPYGRASMSLQALAGRPGVNPLTIERRPSLTVPRWCARLAKAADSLLGRNTDRYAMPHFWKNGMEVTVGSNFRYRPGPRVNVADERGNIDAISEARRQADIVVVSIHAHRQGGWLRSFAARAIDAGADVVVVHGPHEIRGIEIIGQRPVFLSLGGFAYQPDKVDPVPPEAYERVGMDYSASARAVQGAWQPAARLASRRDTYEGLAARVRFSGRGPEAVELLPIDLRYDDPGPHRGSPRLADVVMGRRLIGGVAELSRRFGTTIRYDSATNIGVIALR
jgi:poly-gamma-glutamate synthesis protein (capsule biosynthesis protein)